MMELTLAEKRVAKIKELKEENERLRRTITECEEDNLVLELENTEYKSKCEEVRRLWVELLNFKNFSCCENCKYQSSTPTCTNPKNEVISPDQSSFIIAPDNFGCINWEEK